MIDVYTDGSCLGNPGPGGWAAISGDIFTLAGDSLKTTNNIMEMTAVLKALEKCVEIGQLNINLYTDSNYVKNGMTSWIHKWMKNDWKTANGASVKNKELWIKIQKALDKMNIVNWHWVKAHNGNKYNEMVDKLARDRATALKIYA